MTLDPQTVDEFPLEADAMASHRQRGLFFLGVAFNHVAAVIMPFVGALLWHYAGKEWVFLLGAAGAAVGIPVSLRLPKHVRAAAKSPPTASGGPP